MDNNINFSLSSDTVDNLNAFSEMLQKDVSAILNEALEQYFQREQEKILEKKLEGDSAMTNLDYNEFWDDIDI